ncbi:MAG: OB-fold domain-containing protein [Rubrivivax sp.]
MTADPTATQSPLAQWRRYLARGELAYQFDTVRQCAVFYPRVMAPGSGAALEWRVSRGLGVVHATTWVPARDGSSCNLAIIEMDEGFRLMSRVEGLPAAEVAIGLRVRLRVQPSVGDADAPIPLFDPLEPA